jgi:hypothetical protein
MALLLSRSGIMGRIGSYRDTARGLIRREMRSVRTSEISLSSFTFGVLQGRFKDKGGLTLFALPVDLLAGAAFHVAGMLPFASGYSHHLHAFGDGALASFFTTTGYRVGERWGRGGSLRSGLSGIFGDAEKPVSGGATMADEQLNNLVRAG